ncbi:MAG: cohesin domain-containing protein [Bacilli bacterium]|nr:cohesin domain-containing protein [Bacilli bacterium]
MFIRKILTLFSSLSISLNVGLTGLPLSTINAYAENINSVVLETNDEVVQGNTYFSYVYIKSLENVATLDVSVHYDSSALSVLDTYNQVSCSLYDSSLNEDNVSYSYIFNNDNISSKTCLFYFSYKINDDANIGGSYFDILINEAYDFSLNVITLDGSRKYISISEKEVFKTSYLYGISSIQTKKEEEFELTYSFSAYEIASGSIEIQYDEEVFEFVSLTQNDFLNNKLVDINSSLNGSVYISFLGTEYANSTNIFNIKFKTIKNETITSQIKAVVSDLYDLDLDNIFCDSFVTNVILTYDSFYDDTLPKMFLSSSYDSNNNKVELLTKLGANSNLGAGDFIITWDTEHFRYISYNKKFNPSFFNVNDKFANEGMLKFSIISLANINDENDVIKIIFDVNYPHDETAFQFAISGTGLADSLTNSIYMNFVNCSQTIPGKCTYGEWSTTKEPTCTEAGSEHRICSECGHEETREISAKGHSWEEEWTIDIPANCEHEGSKSHHCSECDAKKDVTVIEKTVHNPAEPVRENEISATCTEDGSYDEVIYCKDCGAEISREHKTIAHEGHSYGEWTTTKEASCTEAGSEHRICLECGHEETREISAKGHSYIHVDQIEPTKSKEGVKEHYICEDCGELFVLVDGKYIKATSEELKIPKIESDSYSGSIIGTSIGVFILVIIGICLLLIKKKKRFNIK